MSADRPQLTKIFAPSIQDPLYLQDVQKVNNYDNFVKNDDEVIGSVSAKSDIDLLKEDKMTQVPSLPWSSIIYYHKRYGAKLTLRDEEIQKII